MAKAPKAPGKKGGKKEKKNVPHGVAHVHATFNNTIVTITDPRGNVLAWSSAGVQGFKGSRKGTPFAAQTAAAAAGNSAKEHGVRTLDVRVKGPGAGRESSVRALQTVGMEVKSIKDVAIDWSQTVAWGDGGYYGRLFLNVKGREPQGIVEPARYEEVRDELVAKLEATVGPDGEPLGTRVLKPQDVYPDVRGVAPDLLVYFGDLAWRSVGSVGNRSIYTFENDTGPDDANHAQEGLLIAAGPGVEARATLDAHLLDVAPTVLELLGLPVPAEMRGRSLVGRLAAAA